MEECSAALEDPSVKAENGSVATESLSISAEVSKIATQTLEIRGVGLCAAHVISTGEGSSLFRAVR